MRRRITSEHAVEVPTDAWMHAWELPAWLVTVDKGRAYLFPVSLVVIAGIPRRHCCFGLPERNGP